MFSASCRQTAISDKGADVICIHTHSLDYNFIRSSCRITVFYKTVVVVLSTRNEICCIPENDLVT
jgi:hypothetical protein